MGRTAAGNDVSARCTHDKPERVKPVGSVGLVEHIGAADLYQAVSVQFSRGAGAHAVGLTIGALFSQKVSALSELDFQSVGISTGALNYGGCFSIHKFE